MPKTRRRPRGKPAAIKPFEFKPGQSGNPGGRPKKTKITDATREWLEQVDERTGKTNAELVAEAQGKEAIRGNTSAYNAMADRTEGKPSQSINLSGEIGLDLETINAKLSEYTERIRARAAKRSGKT